MNKQSEFLRTLLGELAAKEQELAEQKWALDQVLQSPTWRWTAPLRRAINRLRRLRNGHPVAIPPVVAARQEVTDDLESQETDPVPELKASFTAVCRLRLESFLASGTRLDLPRASNPAVSIVLVLFNRAELTLACLQSIAGSHDEDIEVVIVDNASSDETPELLERVQGARIFRNNENRHFLLGVNQAARECLGEHILLLNNDAQLVPGALRSALGTMKSSQGIGAVGGKIVFLDGTLQEAGSVVWQDGSCTGYGRDDNPAAPMYNFRRDVDYCSGAFLLTPRKVWERLGGFDETFSPAYYEETDYCMRLWQAGLRVVYEPAATIIHYEFGSVESSAIATGLQAQHQSVFEQRHRAVLEKRDPPDLDRLLYARSRSAGRRILFIDDRVPHLWLGSGFPRAHALLEALQRLGNFVTLYPLSVLSEPWDLAYHDTPHEIEIMMGMGRELLEAFLRSRRNYYSAIIVSRPHNMRVLSRIRTAHPDWFENVDVIYDAEALVAVREMGLRKLAGNPMTEEEVRGTFESEIRLAGSADCVVTVSESEATAFRSQGIERVEVLGHNIQVAAPGPSFDARKGFLFVGAVHRETSPNADSLIWFLTEIFPRIRRKLGDVPFTIAGVNRSERIRQLAAPPVRITGHLPTLEDLYASARVFVAPTRYAAGIPHKIHEAAAHGLPVVATSLLAEQLGWTECELAIAGDAESFAARCVEIYTDGAKWAGLREAALERVGRECSRQAFDESVRRILAGSKA